MEDMKADLSELTRERAKTQYSMTWRGRCWNMISHLFSLYCIYRLAVVSYGDPFGCEIYQSPNCSILYSVDYLQCYFASCRHHRSNQQNAFSVDQPFWDIRYQLLVSTIKLLCSRHHLCSFSTRICQLVIQSHALLLASYDSIQNQHHFIRCAHDGNVLFELSVDDAEQFATRIPVCAIDLKGSCTNGCF